MPGLWLLRCDLNGVDEWIVPYGDKGKDDLALRRGRDAVDGFGD